MSEPLPSRARCVVIGGGIIGTSTAYHLAKAGWTDTVLVERHRLTAGTTWHAAGLMVAFGSTSETSTRMRQYSKELYTRLEAETGLATGFKPVGFIEVASDPGRLEEYRRVSAFNRHLGVDVHEISPAEVGRLFPAARTDDILAGFYVPDDGRVNPVDVTMSLAKGARLAGARLVEGVTVEDVLLADGRVVGVRTSAGDIECEVVVNAAGMWARQLAAQSGVSAPLQAAEHYYLLTDEIAEVDPSWPVLEDPGRYGYYREEHGGLMVGLFEAECAPWNVSGIPADFAFGTLPPDWDRMTPYLEAAMSRVPIAAETGVRTFFCGPESFTPDLRPIIGPAPEVDGYFLAAGLNSIGILTGGGVGQLLAAWITTGDPGADVTGISPDRLHPYQTSAAYRRTRTVETLGLVYACHYPNRQPTTARDSRLMPLHREHLDLGAYMVDVSGWECPSVYPEPGHAVDPGALTWGRSPWFPLWEAEHHAARRTAALFDMSFMATFDVSGPDARAVVESLSTAAVGLRDGRITYTQWLTDYGRVDADVTVTQHSPTRFTVVATDTAQRHIGARLRRACAGHAATVVDVTAQSAMLSLQGPASRDILAAVADDDLTGMSFRDVVRTRIGSADVSVARMTYVGELGFEISVGAEQAVGLWRTLVEAGAPVGLRPAGLKALGSLRMEKGYRDYGHDVDNTDTLDGVGLGWTAALDKPGGFVGRNHLIAQRAVPVPGRLVQVLLRDPEPLLTHAEVVWRDGVDVGYVRSASYGWTLGGAVALAYVTGELTAAEMEASVWEVDVVDRRVPASVSERPFYDPDGIRIRG